ncbi:MAG: acyl-CoA dehydrogenase [Sphingomonadales bacterium]|jgi:alkylation response protein AidB-like acyl-CoA dehydrogenase
MTYAAPIKDMRNVLSDICDIEGLSEAAFPDLSPDLVDAILEEANKFASGVFAPLNRVGDEKGAILENGVVRLPEGFKEAYQSFVEGGWNCLSGTPDYEGQGLPFVLQTAVQEMITSANMAFSLCPMLSQGAIEALSAHGTDEQKATYLPKLISGEWTGTMNLTEPQAGSDVGALKSKAEPLGDGRYKIKGTKIFITWGEHDCASNIVHLVLARLPGAPEGTKGISLFLVPKFHVNEDGSLGDRNDLRCVSLEHKLGIHASPTCVMSYGDNDECIGYLIGEENRGMACMFTMMNNARIGVGLQGVAIAERAYQAAVQYAKDRVQSAKFGSRGEGVAIIQHADVRRMLMSMKAQIEAARAIVYLTASSVDRAHHGASEDERQRAQGLADLLTPIAKAFGTDVGVDVASIGVQVHGGMGYIEETGAAQHYRDARITPIYEGTNGIQALDLVGRKLGLEGGAHWQDLFADMRADISALSGDEDIVAMQPYLEDSLEALVATTRWLAGQGFENADNIAAGATPYLRMFALVLGGYLLMKQAVKSQDKVKISTARFFAEQFLPQAVALQGPVTRGGQILFALDEDEFAA